MWAAQWERVPQPWSAGLVRLDQAPFSEVFVRNTVYLRSTRSYDFRPQGSVRAGQELCWWLWTVWTDGSRKVDPAMLRWWQRALDAMIAARAQLTGSTRGSVADFHPTLVVREAVRQFYARHGRAPSPGNLRNLESVTYHLHHLVAVRCSDQPWWRQDVWDLAADDRIPRRPHEPHADRTVNLAGVEPDWLRDGLRYWLSQSLILNQFRWTTVCTRASIVGSTFGRFCREHDLGDPTVSDTLPGLRAVFMEFLSWLQSPAATKNGQRPLAATGVNAIQSMVQGFYTFLADNREEAALALGDQRWLALRTDHTRLWLPQYAAHRAGNQPEPGFIATTDLQRMLGWLNVLGADTTERVTVTVPGADPRVVFGLGDPQAARAWLIQAMTGRRASEVLMLDHQPLTALTLPAAVPSPSTTDTNGRTVAAASENRAGADRYVARLRYQQTKVDGVDPGILVEQAVVDVITAQQRWVAERFPDQQPRYLFLTPRGNYRGLRARTYHSHVDALKRLDHLAQLTDAAGRTLRFTTTHRLRHTRATELLNAGVPVHVVQRYLGHKSPEMTMRYAATLAATAEAEFLRYKKIGADGRDLHIAPRDLLDVAQLDRRADRILPNGLCLLPPTASCDKGNACLPCGHFATDRSHLDDHAAQRDRIAALVAIRQQQYRNRHGDDMPDDNIWLLGRRRELASLDAIITRLNTEDAPAQNADTNIAATDHAVPDNRGSTTNAVSANRARTPVVTGAGASGRTPELIRIDTDGAHAAALHAELRGRLSS